MAPSSMWRGCCLLQLDSMGLRQPWCHDNFKTTKPTTYAKLADVVAICMPSGLRPVVFVKRDIDFLEKIREWEIEIYNSAHFPHRRTGFLWTKLLLDNSKVWRFVRSQWISFKVFVMFWSCCIFSRTVLRFPALQSSRQVRRGNCYWMPCLCSRKLEKQSIREGDASACCSVTHFPSLFLMVGWRNVHQARFLMACLNSKPQEIFNTLDIMAGQAIPHWFPLVRPY